MLLTIFFKWRNAIYLCDVVSYPLKLPRIHSFMIIFPACQGMSYLVNLCLFIFKEVTFFFCAYFLVQLVFVSQEVVDGEKTVKCMYVKVFCFSFYNAALSFGQDFLIMCARFLHSECCWVVCLILLCAFVLTDKEHILFP